MALPGAMKATKKDGTVYYRSSITYQSKHISLGSFTTEYQAHAAYLEGKSLLEHTDTFTPDDYHSSSFPTLPFGKWISLINFKNNGLYIKTPIYLRSHFFSYHLSPTDVLLFDADDLFYYSNHSIMRRGNHLFVAEYGMQTNIHSRYGIRNFARLGIDYRFVNGDTRDFRYSNIEILNPYQGVTNIGTENQPEYMAKIHIHGDYVIGRFSSPEEAAIAYNKAADYLSAQDFPKKYEKNYIEAYSSKKYREIYDSIRLPEKIIKKGAKFLLVR